MHNLRPIFITGCPRSGAGIVAEMLNVLGVSMGRVDSSMEDTDIRERVLKPFLSYNGIDSAGQFPLPYYRREWTTLEKITKMKMKFDTFVKPYPWACKDSRLLLCANLIDSCYPGAIWIIVRRNEDEILRSCQKTGHMTAFNDQGTREAIRVTTPQEGWRWWYGKYNYMINELKTSGVRWYEVWPEKLIDCDWSEFTKLCQSLGLIWDLEKIKHLISKLKVKEGIE